MDNVIFFGEGWNNIEFDSVTSFIWSSKESCLECEPYVDSIFIEFYAAKHNLDPLTIFIDDIKYKFDVNVGLNTLELPTKGHTIIKFVSKCFTPSLIGDKNEYPSYDPRELGYRFTKIYPKIGNTIYTTEIKNITTRSYKKVLERITIYNTSTKRYKLNSFFEKVYCITCLTDHERRIAVRKQMSKYNIDFEFVPSIETNHLVGSEQLSKEDYSLCLMHKKCIESAKLNGYGSIVIFEDDFLLEDDWADNFNKFIKELPSDWEFLYLGQPKWMDGIMERKVEKVSEFVDRIYNANGSHFIGISSKIYDLCSELIGEFTLPIDLCYSLIMRDKNRHCYSPAAMLADALSMPHSKYFDKIPNFNPDRYYKSNLRDKSRQER